MPLDDKGSKLEPPCPRWTPSLVEQGFAFIRALHAQSAPMNGQIADKAFIDGLYNEL